MVTSDAPTRTLRLALQEDEAFCWRVGFEPPLDGGPSDGELVFGSGLADVRLRVRLLDEGQAFTLVDVRTLAQLWHIVSSHLLAQVPGRFIPADGEAVTAAIAGRDLQLLLEQTEQVANLGPRTKHISPPIYLQAFWGPRQYAQLDAMIAQMEQINIVPEELVQKGRRLDAPKNWAIVCPPDLPDRATVLEALQPLIDYRAGMVFELQHGQAPMVINNFAAELSRMPLEERPYYLLALGDLDVMSVEYQYFLHSFGAAGRLALGAPEEYAAYAEKVICWEKAIAVAGVAPLLYVATDNDDVNSRNFHDLVEPLAAAADLPTPVSLLAHGRVSKTRVLRALQQLGRGGLAFISAHGFEHLSTAGLPLEEVRADQRAFQGALILDDYNWVRRLGSGDGLLTADDVAEGPLVQSGVLVLHACYSAGTVQRETMPEWVNVATPPRLLPQRPFVSRLGRALLANPEGPLALYAHINRSHQYQYYDPEERGQSLTYSQYHDLLRELVSGWTIGLGRERARRMTIHYMSQAMTLSHQIEWLLTGRCRHGQGGVGWPKKGVEPYERSFLQYSFATCNFRNYVILGDPMARIGAPRRDGE